MTKPTPKRAEPTFLVHAHQLSDSTKEQLLELLGNDEYEAILDIEVTLGIGIDGACHLDEIPRPADYLAVFKPLGSVHN